MSWNVAYMCIYYGLLQCPACAKQRWVLYIWYDIAPSMRFWLTIIRDYIQRVCVHALYIDSNIEALAQLLLWCCRWLPAHSCWPWCRVSNAPFLLRFWWSICSWHSRLSWHWWCYWGVWPIASCIQSFQSIEIHSTTLDSYGWAHGCGVKWINSCIRWERVWKLVLRLVGWGQDTQHSSR